MAQPQPKTLEPINYSPEPTIEDFHQANSIVKGIRGPEGCLSGDTEYLSPDGWKRIDQYDGGEVLQWDHASGIGSWVVPSAYVKLPEKEFLHFRNSNSLSMVLTPEHRVPVYDWNNAFKVKSAARLSQKMSRHIIPTTFFIGGDGANVSDEFIRLGVAINADGHFHKNGANGHCVIDLRKDRKIHRLRWLLQENGVEFTERPPTEKRPTEVRFTFYSPYKGKHYDGASSIGWYALSSRQLAVVIDEMQHWDGEGWREDDPETVFASTCKSDIDYMQFAAHAIGGRGGISIDRNNNKSDKWKDCYKLQVAMPGSPKATVGLRVDHVEVSKIQSSDGLKYCFTVPSSFFVARHNDKVFITGNSGKSVGCFFDLFKYACQQEPYKGKRSTHWTVVRNCYDDKTEILTRDRGFQLFKDVIPDDFVATLQDEKLVYEKPDGILIEDYDGEMIGYEGEGVDFLVTPDHEMWVSKKRTRKQVFGPYHMEYAKDVFKTGKESPRYKVKRNAKWESGKSEYSIDFFEWLGFWFAEGYVVKHIGKDGAGRRRVTVSQTGEEGVEYVRDLFARACIDYNEFRHDDGKVDFKVVTKRWKDCFGNKIFELLNGCGLSHDKSVPVWIKDAPPEHIRAFIDGFVNGDGSVRESGRTVAYTSSKQLADDLQEMSLKAGMVSNINSRDRRGKKVSIGTATGKINHIEYMVSFLCKKKYNPYLYLFDPKGSSRYRGWYKEKYKGKIYCAEMKIPTVYVRRNNKAFWCNRSYPALLTTSLRTFEQWFGGLCIKAPTKQPPVEATIRLDLPDETTVESTFLFLSLDVPDDVKKLKSLETTGGFLNEASEMGRWILTRLLGRCGRWPPKRWNVSPVWSGVLMDTNSCEDDHWWYKAAEEDKPDGWKFFDQPSALIRFQSDKQVSAHEKAKQYIADNQHLPEDFLRIVGDMYDNLYVGNPESENVKWQPLGINYWLNTISGRPLKEINTLVMNEYGPTGDDVPVYPEYQDNIHCAKEILKTIPGIGITLGFDFGLMPACTFSQISPRGQKLFFDEMQVEKHGAMGIRQLSREHIVPYLLDNFLPWLIKGLVCGYGDPAGSQRAQTDEKTCYQILRECPVTNPTGETADFKANGKRLADPEYFRKIREQAGKGYVSMGDIGVEVSPATTNKFGTRRDALAKLLIMRIDGDPAFLLSPKCKTLRKGLRGKYRYKRVQVGGSDERYTNEPIKDAVSHNVESAMYSCLMSSYFAYDSTEESEQVKQAKLDALDTPSKAASIEYAGILAEIKQSQEAMEVWF